jgi:hypothetical protein
MLKKSIDLLKKNPIIIMLYAAYMVVMFLIIFILYPKDLSQFNNPDPATFEIIAYGIVMMKMLIASLIMFLLGLFFMAGYGNLISEAVTHGETSITSFLPGLRKFFVRVLLAMLLLAAFAIGLSIVLSLIIIPITVFLAINGSTSIYMVSIISTLISLILVVFSSPFIILWYPAIFIDNLGIIQGLKSGARVGVKSYWKLIVAMLIICIPIIANVFLNFNSMAEGVIFTPSYIITLILVSIISIVILPATFILYKESNSIVNNVDREQLK